jgi:uncharacterized protein (DUF1778 family)
VAAVAKVSLRIRDAELEAIDRRAAEAGVTRTGYMLRAALDLATGEEQRLESIEDRLERIEVALFQGSSRAPAPLGRSSSGPAG